MMQCSEDKININDAFLGVLLAFADLLLGTIINTILKACSEYYTNVERLQQKYRKKLRKKYNDLFSILE